MTRHPVISAVGHEPDVTISDFVADLRAATPSNAAELAVPDIAEIREALMNLEIRAGQALRREFKALRQRLLELSRKRVLQSPKNYIDDKRMLLDFQSSRLAAAASKKFSVSRERYVRLAAALDAMSPLKVLGRGYAIACGGRHHQKSADVKSGDKIKIRLQKDEINATAD